MYFLNTPKLQRRRDLRLLLQERAWLRICLACARLFLGGRDSLYSIVQMPSGIPVATVAINGGANAALLAVKILAVSDETLLKKLKDYSEGLKEQVQAKDEKLQETGCKAYLEGMKR